MPSILAILRSLRESAAVGLVTTGSVILMLDLDQRCDPSVTSQQETAINSFLEMIYWLFKLEACICDVGRALPGIV